MLDRFDGSVDILDTLHVHGGGLSEILGILKIGKYLWMGKQTTTPDTTNWSAAELGRLWYNETYKRFQWWDGVEVVNIRRIHVSTVDPTPSDGVDGDVWIKYTP